MKDHYSLFVELSQQQCVVGDYANKKKVKAHNLAIKKRVDLEKEIIKAEEWELVKSLLLHEDDRVKCNAAILCIQSNFLHDESVFVLQKLIENSLDPTLRFSAEMAIRQCQQGEQGNGLREP